MEMNIYRQIIKPTLILITVIVVTVSIVVVAANVFPTEREKGITDEARQAAAEILGTDEFEIVGFDEDTYKNVKGVVKAADGSMAVNLYAYGYNSDMPMEILVAVKPDKTVAGVRIIKTSDVPGLGNKTGDFIKQFDGKSGVLELKKDIEIVAGATKSSKGVLEAVNTALKISNEGGN